MILLLSGFARAENGLFALRSVVENEAKDNHSVPLISMIRHGSLVQAEGRPSRYFILTSAHGGKLDEVKVEVSKNTFVHPIGVISDSNADVAWIELDAEDVKRFRLSEQVFAVAPERQDELLVQREFESMPKSSLINMGFAASLPVIPDIAGAGQPGSGPEVKVTSTRLSERLNNVSLDSTGKKLLSFQKISPGHSGAPLVTTLGVARLAGIALSYDHKFGRTYFATEQQAVALLRQYQRGKRGEQAQAHFGYYNGFYKDYGDGTRDIRPIVQSAGGDSSDGGGDSSDGGGGRGRGLSRSSYQEKGLIPGVLWKNHPAIALRVGGLVLYADRAAIEWVRDNGLTNQVQIVAAGSSLTDLYLKRLKKENVLLPLAMRSYPYPAIGRVELDSALVTVLANHHIRFRLRFARPAPPEDVIFELDEQGRLLEPDGSSVSKEFYPVIDVQGRVNDRPGHRYSIDLRPFFFFAAGDPSLNSDNLLHSMLSGEGLPFFQIRRVDREDEYAVDPIDSVLTPAECAR